MVTKQCSLKPGRNSSANKSADVDNKFTSNSFHRKLLSQACRSRLDHRLRDELEGLVVEFPKSRKTKTGFCQLFTLRASRRGRLEARACRGQAINSLSQYPYNCQQVTPNVGLTSPANNKPKVGPGPSKTCFGAFQKFQNRAQTLPRSSPEVPNSSPVASKTPFLGDI